MDGVGSFFVVIVVVVVVVFVEIHLIVCSSEYEFVIKIESVKYLEAIYRLLWANGKSLKKSRRTIFYLELVFFHIRSFARISGNSAKKEYFCPLMHAFACQLWYLCAREKKIVRLSHGHVTVN